MTADRHNDFDRRLRDKLETFEPAVNPGLWDRIQAGLDEKAAGDATGAAPVMKPAPAAATRTLRPGRYWWAAAAILLVTAAGLLYNSREQETLYLRPQTSGRMAQASPEEGPYIGRIPGSQIGSDAGSLSEDLKSISHFLAKRIQATEIKSTDRLHQAAPDPLLAVTVDRPTVEPALLLSAPGEDPRLAERLRTEDMARYVTLQAQTIGQGQGDSGRALPGTGPSGILDPAARESGSPGPDGRSGQGKPLSVSRLLNLMVAQVDKRPEKFVQFTSDEEGSLKMDLKLAQFRTASN